MTASILQGNKIPSDGLASEGMDEIGELGLARKPSARNLIRRKTWPRLQLCLSDIIYWDDGEAEQIGEGFFSYVYKFFHNTSGHTVVVKVIKELVGRPKKDREDLLKEITLLKKLHHENIIKYLGLCAKDGKFFPVLEYINGGGLDTLLTDTTIHLSWSDKIGFALDVAKGMEYLHSNHVFHRDLKSTNCLTRISDNGTRTIIVADFGLAREVPGNTKTPRKMSMVGTAFWMAPELLNGELYNIKVDVFSYGILACEILARVISDPDQLPRTPNFGLDLEKFEKLCPNCPEGLMDLVKDCTEVNNPLKRPNFEEIVKILVQIAAGEEISMYENSSRNDKTDWEIDDRLNNNLDQVDSSLSKYSSSTCSSQYNGTTALSTVDATSATTEFHNITSNQLLSGDRNKKHRHSGLSDDSGISDTVDDECHAVSGKPRDKNVGRHRTKKVSFQTIAEFLSRNCKTSHEPDDMPSRRLTMTRSSSLPDLKTHTRHDNANLKSTRSLRKTRAKSCLYANADD